MIHFMKKMKEMMSKAETEVIKLVVLNFSIVKHKITVLPLFISATN